MKTDLSGKIAVVTGGAKGYGAGIASALRTRGAYVWITGRNETTLDAAAVQLDVQTIRADVTSAADWDRVFETVLGQHGRLDILVNNAGIYPFAPLSQLTSEVFDKVININLKGLFLCTKYVSEQMIKQGKGGKIINITSIDALHPSMIGLSHYDASKHGAWGFTKNVALELAQHKIWVNAIAPGGITTPGTGGKVDPEFAAKIPLGRMGDPDDIGKVVLFLASDMSSYMTGSQIVVDGGYLLK